MRKQFMFLIWSGFFFQKVFMKGPWSTESIRRTIKSNSAVKILMKPASIDCKEALPVKGNCCASSVSDPTHSIYLSCKPVFTECRCVCFMSFRLQHHDSVSLKHSRVSSDDFTARAKPPLDLWSEGITRSGCSGYLVWIVVLRRLSHFIRSRLQRRVTSMHSDCLVLI